MIKIATYRSKPEDISTPILFDIGFLGYTSELSVKGLRQFAENNKEEIERVSYNSYNAEIRMKDGTRIRAITYGMNLRGYRFDQLILFDDKRKLIGTADPQYTQIHNIIDCTMYMSNVPEE